VAHIGENNCIQGFWWGNPKRKRSQHLGFLKKPLGGGKWIELAEDRERWWAVMSAEMEFLVP